MENDMSTYLRKLDDCIATFESGCTDFEDTLKHIVRYYDLIFSFEQDGMPEIAEEAIPYFNRFLQLVGMESIESVTTFDSTMYKALCKILWGSADSKLFDAVTCLVPDTIKAKYNILYWENWLLSNRKDYYEEVLERFKPKSVYLAILRRK